MNRAEFRRMAEIKAKITVAKRRRMREAGVPVAVGPDKGENAYIKSPLSGEELKVVEAYRKWKRARVQEGEAAAPADVWDGTVHRLAGQLPAETQRSPNFHT